MFWSDKLAKTIIDSGSYRPFWVDDMFTPSGYAHIGSLRGPIVHDAIYRSLVDAGHQAVTTYVFNDFDPIDGLPEELSVSQPYLGFPLRTAPSPFPGYDSFAHYFTENFKSVLTALGVRAEFRSSWDMYHEGIFDGVIREALDHAELIQDIYRDVSGSRKRENGWLPLQVICEKCGRVGTTRVTGWDGELVTYTCEPAMVTWAAGCGHTGTISPFGGNGKLPWKVDWPAHWKVMGVTIEGAGKDHSSAGGSRDIARALCDRVFGYPDPYNVPYEFFLIGGKKMSSSKGLGLKAKDLTGILPPEVARFLFVRTDYRQAIEFNPVGTMAIPDLFDEYDRAYIAYVSRGDESLSRCFELSQIRTVPERKEVFLPRFRDVANYLQLPNVDITRKFETIAGRPLTQPEQAFLEERIRYARIWVETYAPVDLRHAMAEALPSEAASLTDGQKQFLSALRPLVDSDTGPEELQRQLYEAAKSAGIPISEAFAAIYLIFTGKRHGPRAAWFIRSYPKATVLERMGEALAVPHASRERSSITGIDRTSRFFTIDHAVSEAYPSISVGVACLSGVKIAKTDPDLDKEKEAVIKEVLQFPLEEVGKFPEIVSYRKLYRDMGVDWHSRRPSPEALIRRVIQGKGLYTVNTLVDAYNLVVIRRRVSVGAFDMHAVQFPTRLQFAGDTDEILLLGDVEPTRYKQKELAYYDADGGYNIDFNYRDAQRTRVTEETTDVWINVDGVNDITPDDVYRTLLESIEIIRKYCGGEVTHTALVTADRA